MYFEFACPILHQNYSAFFLPKVELNLLHVLASTSNASLSSLKHVFLVCVYKFI